MRYENPRPVYPNELYHHGIMGQHWGETNGPPYPLGSGTHNRVVRQGREERKQLKAEYKDARQDVRNSAHQLLAARKDANRYGSSGNAKKQAIAKDASARVKFYEKQYKKSLDKYKDAAAKAGKSVKYNDKSLKRAAFLAGNHNATGVLAQQAFGLVGAAIANRANNNSIRRWAAGKESQAKFDRFANQKNYKVNKDSAKMAAKQQKAINRRLNSLRFAERVARQTGDLNSLREIQKIIKEWDSTNPSSKQAGLEKAKAAYKEQKAPRHTGSSAPKTTKQSGGTSMQRSAATEKNAIMKEMNRRFGNSEKNKAALSDLKNMLKTTKGEYDKNTKTTTYVTQYGIFDVYPGPNGTIRVAFND